MSLYSLEYYRMHWQLTSIYCPAWKSLFIEYTNANHKKNPTYTGQDQKFFFFCSEGRIKSINFFQSARGGFTTKIFHVRRLRINHQSCLTLLSFSPDILNIPYLLPYNRSLTFHLILRKISRINRAILLWSFFFSY